MSYRDRRLITDTGGLIDRDSLVLSTSNHLYCLSTAIKTFLVKYRLHMIMYFVIFVTLLPPPGGIAIRRVGWLVTLVR